jgi:uncharacterized protein
MTSEFSPFRLDVQRFAQGGGVLSGGEPLPSYARLLAESAGPEADAVVAWKAVGESRIGAGGTAVPWMRVSAQTRIRMICQRCLVPMDVDLGFDRWFRFAADEATAALEDEEAEEEVLAMARDLDLHALIEDELLMEIPVAPRHEVCPEPVKLSSADPDFDAAEAARPNPFAALDALRTRKP